MQFSILNLCALSMLGGVFAVDHHAHKREAGVQYVTVQATHYVTVGANGQVSTAEEAVAVTTTEANNYAYSPPTVTKETSAEAATSESESESETSAAASASESEDSDDSSSSSDASAGSSGALGITYTPYADSGACKTADQVKADLAQLSGYSLIRLYNVDCSQVENVYANLASGQKLFLGIWDMSDIAGSVSKMAAAINNDWDVVDTVSVGNELVNNGEASVAQVKSYTSEAKQHLRAAGYNGPVTTCDTFIATINNPELCDASDYITVNAHAFFDGNVAAADAGSWVLQQIQRVASTCGNKKVVITETGWPWQCETNGKASCSESNQAAAIQSIKDTCGDDVFLFTAYNDNWKAPGAYSCEQHWGFLGNHN